MHTRKVEQLTIQLKTGGTHKFLKALVTLHGTWIEVVGWQVLRDTKPSYKWVKNDAPKKKGQYYPDKKEVPTIERGTRTQTMVNQMYPEGSIQYVNLDSTKMSLVDFKKSEQ